MGLFGRKLTEWEKKDGKTTAWKDEETGRILIVKRPEDRSKIALLESKNQNLKVKYDKSLEDNRKLKRECKKLSEGIDEEKRRYKSLWEYKNKLEDDIRENQQNAARLAEKNMRTIEELEEKIHHLLAERPDKNIVKLLKKEREELRDLAELLIKRLKQKKNRTAMTTTPIKVSEEPTRWESEEPHPEEQVQKAKLLDKGKKIGKIGNTNIHENPYNEILEKFCTSSWYRYDKISQVLTKYYERNKRNMRTLRSQYIKFIKKKCIFERKRREGIKSMFFKISPKIIKSNVEKKRRPHVRMKRMTTAH